MRVKQRCVLARGRIRLRHPQLAHEELLGPHDHLERPVVGEAGCGLREPRERGRDCRVAAGIERDRARRRLARSGKVRKLRGEFGCQCGGRGRGGRIGSPFCHAVHRF